VHELVWTDTSPRLIGWKSRKALAGGAVNDEEADIVNGTISIKQTARKKERRKRFMVHHLSRKDILLTGAVEQ